MSINRLLKPNRDRSLAVLVLLAFLCIFANTVYAQEFPEPKEKNNFIWSITTEKNTVYLLGSFHMLKANSFPLNNAIENAYEDSQQVVFEADLNAMNDPDFQTKMMTSGLYPEGQNLQQNVSAQTYKLLEEKTLAIGLSMALLSRFKPWFAALTLTVVELQRLGFDPTYGVDSYFFAKAKENRKQVTFLETAEYQLQLFTELSRDEEESFLRQTLEDLEVVETMLPEMVSAWKNGAANKLESILGISFEQHPDIYYRLISQRNRKWIKQIENFLEQDDNVLVIVGAAHLVGPENILGLLRNRGYEIVQR